MIPDLLTSSSSIVIDSAECVQPAHTMASAASANRVATNAGP